MFKQRSKMLFVTSVLSLAYAIYIISYVVKANSDAADAAEKVGSALATAMLTPHMVMMILGAIFCWLGFFLKANWGALVGAILFCVGLVFMPIYFMFSVPLLIFGFISFSNQKKINQSRKLND
ncbi:MAG: hypothetical protein K2F81_09080 [Ruminococcus sp.]|nr:hypothetical protein [Ruminococcus sp.]